MHCDDVVDVVFQAVNDEVKQLKDREKSVADGRDAQSPATVCCRRFFYVTLQFTEFLVPSVYR